MEITLRYPVISFLFATFSHSSEGLSGRSSDGLSFINFKPDEYLYLNITSIGSNLVQDGSECGFACLEIPSCFSYNLAAVPDINKKKLCELLPSDKYNNTDKFIASPVFHHFSVPSPCSRWPCENNGTCVPQYEKNSYVCLCTKEFSGKHCQTNLTAINECESNPCLNDGTCSDQLGGFNCSCVPGFYGDRCETGRLSNSTIIGGNVSYQSRLYQFLTPAVGLDPQWVLCYRASTHGWAVSTFHSRCDGKRDTVTIIKKGQYVFGGYTDIPWESGSGYGHTSNAFIFSLRNKEGLGPFKSMVTDSSEAIYRHSSYGPTFGRGHDIYIANNANSNTDSYSDFGQHNDYSVPSGVQDQYTILAGTNHFTPEEVEVFYLG